MPREDVADRARGALLASAAGDALGAGYEFTTPGPDVSIGMIGGGPFGFEPGEWTDDTSMAIAVAQAAASADLRTRRGLDEVAAGFMRWFAGGPKDVGNQTRAVLSAEPSSALDMRSVAFSLRGRTGGNGSLMRTGPVALGYLDDLDGCVVAARAVSELTHADPRATEACGLWSYAIGYAITTGSFDGPADYLDRIAPQGEREFWAPLLRIAETGTPADFPNNGWVVHALQTAWWAIAGASGEGADHLVNALERCIRAGHDTDTTAAIAGALLGARWGASVVPREWYEMLHGWPGLRADDLVALADAIVAGPGRNASSASLV